MSYMHENEDRLTHLPEDVLSQILSLMPTKLAVRTSILSKRWRYNWTLVTNLDFKHDHPDFVDRVLKLCKTSKIKRFRLRFYRGTTSELKSNISRWVNEAVRLNVCEADLRVTPLETPLSLFTCKTLTKLRLVRPGVIDFIGPSVVIILPLLKTLHIKLPGVESAFRLIHGCPVLEDLSLETITFYEGQDYNFNIPTLKRLKLNINGYANTSPNKVVLNVPNLEYIWVGGVLYSRFVIEDLSSLVEATVRLSYMKVNLNHLYAELLKGISRAKSITLFSHTLDVLLKSPLPKFPNLKYLELEGYLDSESLKLFQHLESSSELEHLCFREPEESWWIEPHSVPTWMLTNLKTMEITRCKGRECDIQFIKHVLGNSKVLKTLTITVTSLIVEDEMRLCAWLSKCPQATKFCQIHFVGKWLLNIF